jgi:hypothetical protein
VIKPRGIVALLSFAAGAVGGARDEYANTTSYVLKGTAGPLGALAGETFFRVYAKRAFERTIQKWRNGEESFPLQTRLGAPRPDARFLDDRAAYELLGLREEDHARRETPIARKIVRTFDNTVCMKKLEEAVSESNLAGETGKSTAYAAAAYLTGYALGRLALATIK